MMHWYAHQVVNHPTFVILLTFSFSITCVIVALTLKDLPSFQDPLLGFEVRGTVIAQRSTAWHNLLKSSSWSSGVLSMYPGKSYGFLEPSEAKVTGSNGTNGESDEVEYVNETDRGNLTTSSEKSWSVFESEEQKLGTLLKFPKEGREMDSRNVIRWKELLQPTKPRATSKFFCNDPARAYAHVVFEHVDGKNLFTGPALRSMCRIEKEQLSVSEEYERLCEESSPGVCCRPWSLPNYVALLRNRSSCETITDDDVSAVGQLLSSCAYYYHRLKLTHDCASDPLFCRGVPAPCMQHNAVYNVFHYLVDVNFLQYGQGNASTLSFSAVFLPVAQSTAAMPYYHRLQQQPLADGTTRVVAMQLGLKHELFNECLLRDTLFVGLAGLVVFVCLWMYTTSYFVTVMALLAVAFSLGIAYFLYTVVFQIPFFPFMNVLAIVIAVGIGADDTLIYYKMWVCAKAEKNSGTLVKLVRDTLHHSCLSMFVTTATTAAAFFASFISTITAVRCFSIFAGTAVLANFLFTVTWLPASVIISEKWCSWTCCLCIPPFGIYLPQFQKFRCCSFVCNSLWKMHHSFADFSRVFFEKILPCFVIRPRYVWLVLYLAVACGGAIVVFYKPQLRLPDSKEFQIFSADHPFERYDLRIKKEFWFEKVKDRDLSQKLPIRIVWGVLPVDNGHYLDPFERGSSVFDATFNVALPESQTWLLDFCKSLRNQSFYQSTLGPLVPNCFIETFKSWMERRCFDGVSPVDRSPCCEVSTFPYSEDVFNKCLREAIGILHRKPSYYFVPGVAGPRFSKEDGSVKAVVVEYDSVYSYTNSYVQMDRFRTSVETWMADMLATAPPGMKNGWFTSDLDFFDLQDSLSRGTLVSMAVAICASLASLLVTTLNVMISVYAIVTIAFVIFVTIGSLVLLGWKLNVLESITVSVAIGLAVDFTLHYAVAYRLSTQEDRELSVIHALSRVGSPVAMAAFTTFVAGALMFPSVVLAYIQIGTFLMILTTVSWLYATFFFQSVLRIVGPQKGCLQLDYPSVHCFETGSSVPVDKTAYALSESTLSTSSVSYLPQIQTSESHELEPLTVAPGSAVQDRPRSSRSGRQRSKSLSVAFSQDVSLIQPPRSSSSSSRKVSLPAVMVARSSTFHGSSEQPSPSHVISGATSSSTIAGTEDDALEPICFVPHSSSASSHEHQPAESAWRA